MTKRLGLIATASLILASPAHAGYVFDPEDLPEGFICVDEPEELPCYEQKRHEAWYNVYGERYWFWLEALLFRTDIYFADRVAPLPVLKKKEVPSQLSAGPQQTNNLIDAYFDV